MYIYIYKCVYTKGKLKTHFFLQIFRCFYEIFYLLCKSIYFLPCEKSPPTKVSYKYTLVWKFWHRDVMVITISQLHSSKFELRFCASLKPARGVSEIHVGEGL